MTDRILVILAGGKSSRMGRDKTFLPYANTTFLEYLIRKARPCFPDIFISAGSQAHGERIGQFLEKSGFDSRNIIIDRYDQIGPMGGILSVFESIGKERFVLLAVDIPDADMNVLAALSDLAGKRTEAALMLCLSDTGQALKGIEACAAVYHRRAYELLKVSCERREYSIRKALGEDQIHCIGVSELKAYLPDISEEGLKQAFRNINTPQDLHEILRNGKAGSL